MDIQKESVSEENNLILPENKNDSQEHDELSQKQIDQLNQKKVILDKNNK